MQSHLDLIAHIRSVAFNPTDEEKNWPTVAVLDGSVPVIEVVVAQAVTTSGIDMNWGYVGGRAVVSANIKADDEESIKKCRRFLKLAIPQSNIDHLEY